ncbi:MAG: MFS transporter [Candidatus Omnitrophica bacterium]|nr:MFS transporter [Candidatus Omnitrophota bacterium]
MPRKHFWVFCLLFFTLSFGVAATAALVPSIAEYFGRPKEEAIRLTWLYMLPYGIFALFWAPLTRVVRIKTLLTCATAGFSVAAFLFSFAPTLPHAFLYRFLMGSFGCSFVPLSLIAVGKTVDSGKKGKYIGTFFSLSWVSTLISVFLSGFIPWRMIYLVPAVLALCACLLVRLWLEDLDFRQKGVGVSYLRTLRDPAAFSFFLVIMAGSFLYHGVQQRLGMFFADAFSLRQVVISSIYTLATLSAIVFEFTGGHLCSRFGNIPVTRVGFFVMSGFILLLLCSRQMPVLIWSIPLWGAGWALTHVGISSRLTDFPDQVMRDASSLNSSLRFTFGGLGAFAGGLLLNIVGFGFLFLIMGTGIVLLGAVLPKMLGRRGAT